MFFRFPKDLYSPFDIALLVRRNSFYKSGILIAMEERGYTDTKIP